MTTEHLHKLSLRAEHSVDSWNTTELPPWVDPSDPPPGPPGSPYPPWPPDDFCTDFVSRLKIHAADVIQRDSCQYFSASGGVPPYSFSIVRQSGNHYWIDDDENKVCADEDACGSVTIRVTDACLYTADHDFTNPFGGWVTKARIWPFHDYPDISATCCVSSMSHHPVDYSLVIGASKWFQTRGASCYTYNNCGDSAQTWEPGYPASYYPPCDPFDCLPGYTKQVQCSPGKGCCPPGPDHCWCTLYMALSYVDYYLWEC